MGSLALGRWREERATRLENLVTAHRAVAGQNAGRKWLTAEVNHALIVRLSSEFQGYCRELHDESIAVFIDSEIVPYTQNYRLVRALMENGRKLDSQNANWGNVCSDFARLGLALAAELEGFYPGRYQAWVTKLDRLNAARNAIAHDDRVKLAECEADQPLTLSTFRNWRSALNGITAGIDRVVGAYLKDLTGTQSWEERR